MTNLILATLACVTIAVVIAIIIILIIKYTAKEE